MTLTIELSREEEARRREEHGISYLVVPQPAIEMMAPVVEQLTGT